MSIEEKKRLELKKYLKVLTGNNGTACFLIAIIIFNSIVTANFFAAGTLRNLIVQSFPVLIMGLGMTSVVSSGGIDISVGSLMAISACVMGLTGNYGIAVSIIFGLLTGLAFGIVNGLIISVFDIQPTIMTLITMIIARGLAQIITDGKMISLYSSPISAMVKYKMGGYIPVQIVIMIILIPLAGFFLKKTVSGICIQAVGENAAAARLCGISKISKIVIAYGMAGIMAALAGIFEAGRGGLCDSGNLGYLMEMDVIAAVVIGGTPMCGGKADIIGTCLGSVIIVLVTITCNMNNISYYYGYILKAIIIIVAVFSQNGKE